MASKASTCQNHIITYDRRNTLIDQKLERQLENLKIFGIENRPIFQETLSFVRIGNQFVMKYIDLLGRNLIIHKYKINFTFIN